MKENDYYGHYKTFINELKQNPEQTLQVYCRDHGVVWRRLYDWMRRHHISLKRIYLAYRGNTPVADRDMIEGRPVEFRELIWKNRSRLGQCAGAGWDTFDDAKLMIFPETFAF